MKKLVEFRADVLNTLRDTQKIFERVQRAPRNSVECPKTFQEFS